MTGKWVEPGELPHSRVYAWADGRHDHQEALRATLLEIRVEVCAQTALLRDLVGIFRCSTVQAGFRALRSLAKIERAREKAKRERAAKRKAKR